MVDIEPSSATESHKYEYSESQKFDLSESKQVMFEEEETKTLNNIDLKQNVAFAHMKKKNYS